MKRPLAAAGALLISSAVMAQTAQVEWVEVNEDVVIGPWNLTVEELDDRDIYDAAGKEIGEVEAVLGTGEGVVSAIAVEVEEGLFNDDDTVVFQLTDLTLQDDRLVTSLTKEQIEALPEWDD